MRFLPNGPCIPDDLLEARDNGNVVFFCGAGVSQPAGLPGFLGLTQQLIEKLGTPRNARSRLLLARVQGTPEFPPPLDQIFHTLRQEYGATTIDTAVSELLAAPADSSLECHSIILRISRSAGQRPQLITTNFDLLFERACEQLRIHVAPALPDLRYGQPLDGLVYLHGRRVEAPSDSSEATLILSSADFGRAYLAEGWATRFVTDLLRHYVIVLVGYSATDPPVRYLLEGLHARGDTPSATIYAFDRGSAAEVEERWRDRGIRALAYPDGDSHHSALWDTLRAWAEQADDPYRWRRSVVELAQQRPTTLQSYQRGQVASLIRTEGGAKLFADASPSPPAEWLCVLDGHVRCGEPQTVYGQESTFDPLDHYGLDDDPVRSPHFEHSGFGMELLSGDSTSGRVRHRTRLADIRVQQYNPLPPRLFHLARWLGKSLNDPVLAWWAAGQRSLHPVLLDLLERELTRDTNDIHEFAYRAWTLCLERFRSNHADELDHRWYVLAARLKRDGWIPAVLREFERVARPSLTFARPRFGSPSPPSIAWENLRIRDVISFEVKFPRVDLHTLTIPEVNLPAVFRILRRGLEEASGLLSDIETTFWETATFHPERTSGGAYIRDVDRYLQQFVRLFDVLASQHPNVARMEVNGWPSNETFFFDKLRLYAGLQRDVWAPDDLVSWMITLPEARFWALHHRRELLHTLRARWEDLDSGARKQIETHLIAGPRRWKDEQDADYATRKASLAATILGWLERSGCELSAETRGSLPSLREADPFWQPALDEIADRSYEPRGGWVKTESDPSEIIDLPVPDILDRAEQNSGRHIDELTVEHNPFRGLVERRPLRALSALSYWARRDRIPTGFWQTLISHWPDNVSARLRWTLAYRLVRLPGTVVAELRYYVPDWFRKNLPLLAQSALSRALDLWDRLFDHFRVAGAEATSSSIGDVFVRGKPQNTSRRTYQHAINAPIGQLTAALLEILQRLSISAGSGVPAEIRVRLQHTLSAPGEGRDHAISTLGAHLTWLHQLDSDWDARDHPALRSIAS